MPCPALPEDGRPTAELLGAVAAELNILQAKLLREQSRLQKQLDAHGDLGTVEIKSIPIRCSSSNPNRACSTHSPEDPLCQEYLLYHSEEAPVEEFSAQKMMPRADWKVNEATLAQIGQPDHSIWAECLGLVQEVERSPAISRRVSAMTANYTRNTWDWDEYGQIPIWTCACISLPLSPNSTVRLAWDTLGAAFIFYEALTLPLVLLVLPSGYTFSLAEWLLNSFWTLDIVLTFLTSVSINQELQSSFLTIAKQYTKTWLFIDLWMVVPQWILLLAKGGSTGGLSILRMLKVARAFRLLRMLKMEKVVRAQLQRVNSLLLLKMISLTQILFGFLMLNHMLACIWYCIGHESADGWFWARGLLDTDITAGYLLALHWSITQFHGSMDVNPNNITERIFAVCVLVVGLVSSSIFVSVTTDMILQVRQTRKKSFEQQQSLRMYFMKHTTVSAALMLRVKNHFEQAMNEEAAWINDNQVLKGLPKFLELSLLHESRTPAMESHPFFSWISDNCASAFRDICCRACSTFHGLSEAAIFTAGDSWEKMFFVEAGHLRYVERSGPCEAGAPTSFTAHMHSMATQVSRMRIGTQIKRSSWLCELALWVEGYRNSGDLISVSSSTMLCVDSNSLAQVLKNFPPILLKTTLYVRWVVHEASGCIGTDLWEPKTAFKPSRDTHIPVTKTRRERS